MLSYPRRPVKKLTSKRNYGGKYKVYKANPYQDRPLYPTFGLEMKYIDSIANNTTFNSSTNNGPQVGMSHILFLPKMPNQGGGENNRLGRSITVKHISVNFAYKTLGLMLVIVRMIVVQDRLSNPQVKYTLTYLLMSYSGAEVGNTTGVRIMKPYNPTNSQRFTILCDQYYVVKPNIVYPMVPTANNGTYSQVVMQYSKDMDLNINFAPGTNTVDNQFPSYACDNSLSVLVLAENQDQTVVGPFVQGVIRVSFIG